MADNGYPVEACLELLKELAYKHNYGPDGPGLYKLGKDCEIGVPAEYLKNSYYEFSNLLKTNPKATKSFKNNYFDVIAREVGCSDLKDFVSRKGYSVPQPTEYQASHHVLYQRNPPEAAEWIDKYVLGARVLPALLGVMPLMILIYALLIDRNERSSSIYIIGLLICVALAWGLSGWLATQGKRWEKRLFFSEGRKGFATAYMMLFSIRSKYSDNQKVQYRQKITRYFGIEFPSKEDELEDDKLALQKLHRAVFTLKNVVKSVVIRSALIRYGFLRNLIPAALLAAVLCAPGLLYAWWQADLLFVILLGLYAFASIYYYLFHEKAVRRASEAYARYLIDEFLSR
ncbi:hypothetical protein JMN32_12160 [Fulvivirga sp. 29W222]|uniref:Uncharacterized protein n=1 Tax=Fulvivirga marina TaxID=2494733 RepID=A0A937FY00_9BACT|nr:hypothetical protein [Fulvivirga marina]MBL6447067.1 hypothetical protein [Fulvivirga marina]